MTRVINYATKYSNVIDEAFRIGAKSENCVNKDYDFKGGKSVKVYSISTAEMNDYERSGTSRYGIPEDLDATVQDLVMTQDRSFTIVIDKMDEDETGGALNAGTALARQLRDRVIPEIDTYRFTKMAANAGTKVTGALTAANIYESILAATEELDDEEVPYDGRFIVVPSATYALMKQSDDIVLDTDVGQEMRARGVIAMYDGMEVIQVTSKRLPENAGFIVGHPSATTSPVKLEEYKIHEDVPGISGSLVEGRIYYDAFVLNNKAKALYYYELEVSTGTNGSNGGSTGPTNGS